MSYLHCPQCSHAYNLAVTSICPCCPVAVTVVDAEEDILAAADALARAMARATPAERTAAATRIQQLAVPAPTVITRAPPAPTLLTRLAESLVDRVAPRLGELAEQAQKKAREAAPKVLALLPRRATSVWRRVRALAA
jgi:hypothetical protein